MDSQQRQQQHQQQVTNKYVFGQGTGIIQPANMIIEFWLWPLLEIDERLLVPPDKETDGWGCFIRGQGIIKEIPCFDNSIQLEITN